jgi:hypothetical protein
MTRQCPACKREITAELLALDGADEVVDLASDAPDIDDPETINSETVEGIVRLSCSCASYDVEVSGTAHSLALFPYEWEYEPRDENAAAE